MKRTPGVPVFHHHAAQRLIAELAAEVLGEGEEEPLPRAVIFVNSGVRLAAEGSPLLDDLRELADRGVEILSCRTRLDFYGLKERLQVGTVTNMLRIVTLLSAADRILSAT